MQIGFTGATNSLLASGIYGVVKVVATALFVFFLVESLGRRLSLIISSIGMGTLFFIIAAILKTHPPPTTVPIGFTPPACEQGDGGDAVHLRMLLQHGVGPAAVGIRQRHFPNCDAALWIGGRKRFAMALQYV